jgi:hypothetical protein
MIDAGVLDELRGNTVSEDYLHRLVDELAAAADHLTGRACMPGHEELGAKLGRPTKRAKMAAMALMTPAARQRTQGRIDRDRARQVTNAINVLKAATLLVCVEEGRMLTAVEKIELYANGVDRRYARAVYALTLPRPVMPVDNSASAGPAPEPIFGPPRSGKELTHSSDSLIVFTSVQNNNSVSKPDCAQPKTNNNRHKAEHLKYDAATRRPAPKRRALWEIPEDLYAFVIALRKALPMQLSGASPRKLASTTKRFWKAGWDALSVASAVTDLYDRDGRQLPHYRPGNPAAWLGSALKQIDHTTTPQIRRYDDWAAAAETEPCPHQQPGGARISIITGKPKCPICRADHSE